MITFFIYIKSENTSLMPTEGRHARRRQIARNFLRRPLKSIWLDWMFQYHSQFVINLACKYFYIHRFSLFVFVLGKKRKREHFLTCQNINSSTLQTNCLNFQGKQQRKITRLRGEERKFTKCFCNYYIHPKSITV